MTHLSPSQEQHNARIIAGAERRHGRPVITPEMAAQMHAPFPPEDDLVREKPRAGYRAPGRSDPDDVTIINPLAFIAGNLNVSDFAQPEPAKYADPRSPIVGKF